MLSIPVSLLFAHLVADFFLQSDWMALNKSKSNYALFVHVCAYTLGIGLWGVAYVPDEAFAFFVVAVFLTHFLTDWVTSRINSKLWFFKPVGIFYNVGKQRYEMYIPEGGNRHWFFVGIGVDQFIHYATLAAILTFLRG